MIAFHRLLSGGQQNKLTPNPPVDTIVKDRLIKLR